MIDHVTMEPAELVRLAQEKMNAEGISLNGLERATGIARQSWKAWLSHEKVPAQLTTRKKIADWLNGDQTPPASASSLPPGGPAPWEVKQLRAENDKLKAENASLRHLLMLAWEKPS